MSHWNKLFPSFIFNISYESLIGDTKNQINKLLTFCNLEWQDDCLKFYNNKRPIKTASDIQARNKIFNSSINSWINYEKHLKKYMDQLKN